MEAERAEHGLTAVEIGFLQRNAGRLGPEQGPPELVCTVRSPGLPDERWNVPIPGIESVTARSAPTVDLDLRGLRARLTGAAGVQRLQSASEALWLAVTAEHPILPAIDWESGLADLRLPLLRLPGRIGAPTRSSRRPRVAICAAMPAAKLPFEAVDLIDATVAAIMLSAPVEPEVHIFADTDTSSALQSSRPSVFIHDPVAEGPHGLAHRDTVPMDRLDQPWLRWIARAMAADGLDVLHLIGHGFVSSCDGAFAVAEAPDHNVDAVSARFVWSQQVTALLAELGAWSLVITAAPRNFSVAGLRLLATQVCALRSAAVACHDADRARPDTLADVYRALLGYPTAPPSSSEGLMMMMHPERFGSASLEPRSYVPGPSYLADLVDSGAVVPSDLVGARRQIAQWENQLAVRSSTSHLEASRTGLELAKSRLDQVLRDTDPSGGLS